MKTTEASTLAAKGHKPFMVARFTLGSQETMGKNSTLEKLIEFFFNELGKAIFMLIFYVPVESE